MAEIKVEEKVIETVVLRLTDDEAKGLYKLLGFGVDPNVLQSLGLYSVNTALNNFVGIRTPVDVNFGYRATFALPDVDDDTDGDDDEHYCGIDC